MSPLERYKNGPSKPFSHPLKTPKDTSHSSERPSHTLTILFNTMQFKLGFCLLASMALSSLALPTPKNDTVAKLLTAATAVDRLNLLQDVDFVFDFFNPNAAAISASTPNGHTVAARRDTFPALVGSGLAMTVGFLGPCGLNTPHTHPRSAEFNIAINGTLRAGMLEENGARFVMNTLNPGQATLFPRGAIHFEQNLGCQPAMFVAAFSDEDPGVSQLTNLADLPVDIVQAVLGESNADVQHLISGIPKNIALGVEECLQRCGIKH